MPSTLRPRGTYGGTGLKKRPLKKRPLSAKRRLTPRTPVWSVTSAPSGFTLVTMPTKTTPGVIGKGEGEIWNQNTIPGLYATLRSWATSNKLQLTPTDFSIVRYNDWSECFVWTKFEVAYNVKPNNDKYLGSHTCSDCNTTIQAGTTFCTQCTRFLNCVGCYTSGLKLHGVTGSGDKYCARCAATCSKSTCENLISPNDEIKECVACSPREACSICKKVTKITLLSSKTHNNKTYKLCGDCTSFVCEDCGIPDRSVKSVNNKKLCSTCVQKITDKERKKYEIWEKDELPISGTLVLPSTRSRPIRTISIETEFDGSSAEVSKSLYRSGLIESPAKSPYSSQGNGRLPCLLKGDSSVTGGELVTYLIDLDNENHAAALLRMTEVMRGCRELGHAEFSTKAGGHIHIDLHGYSIEDLWTLYTTFKYLEMPLYYLGGAGASYGHRSLKGSSYAPPPNGGPYGTVESFAQGFKRQGRSGLNLSNFNGALMSCVCGAVTTGNWKKCSCNLGKATAEWRLWNAEINPRILHAWIAIMQSMTAYAIDTPCNEASMPYLEWTKKNFSALPAKSKVELKKRLEWMHTILPLNSDERDSIVYAAKKSQLADFGDKYLDSLLTITNTAAGVKETPRNPSSRKGTKFSLKQEGNTKVSVSGIADTLGDVLRTGYAPFRAAPLPQPPTYNTW